VLSLLLLLAVVSGPDEPPLPRGVLMPVAEHKQIAGALSRELGLTTLELDNRTDELEACEKKLSTRTSTTIAALVLPEPLPPAEGWSTLEVVGISAIAIVVAGAVGFGIGAAAAP
jgi:hypothetical protein